MRRWGVLLLVLVPTAVAWLYWGRLAGLDDPALARRLLGSRGIWCTPKIVERPEEGVLRIVCADGTYTFAVEPSCDESFACDTLGFDAACWQRTD